MNWRPRDAFAMVSVAILGVTATVAGAAEKPGPLVVQEQGSFAVGGTVVTAPGTFDPIATVLSSWAQPGSGGTR